MGRNAVSRTLDVVISGLCLIVFSPLFALCWWCIRREDHGPAIYSQERIGLGGKPFRIYKFRTMRMDAEADGPQLSGMGRKRNRLGSLGLS